jgi:hypothetical protein
MSKAASVGGLFVVILIGKNLFIEFSGSKRW